MSGRTHNTATIEIAAPAPEEPRAPGQAEIDILQDRLDQAERVARDLQGPVTTRILTGGTMTPEDAPAVALKKARDHAKELRTALDEAQAAFDRERLGNVSDRFAECAKNFGAEVGSNGWASAGDVPSDVLAACLDPMIVALAADQISGPRIFNQVRQIVERAQPAACIPFMPRELFDSSGPVRAVILEQIRQAVK